MRSAHDGPGRREREGFALLEVVIALTLFAGALLGVAATYGQAESASGIFEAKQDAVRIASQTLQEVEALGYATVSEGISCTTAKTTHKCSGTDPNQVLTFGGTSNPCWYYGPASTKKLVPTVVEDPDESHSTVVPIIPYVSGTSIYPDPVENGVTFTVATYPIFDESQFPQMTCTGFRDGSVQTIPVIVKTIVRWGSPASTVSLETTLYKQPSITTPTFHSTSNGKCTNGAPGGGANQEANLAFTSGTVAPQTSTVAPGGTASILFVDEGPSDYNPTFCVYTATGQIVVVSVTITAVQYFGYNKTHTFLSDVEAVHSTPAGSGPNAASPPSPGGVCASGQSNTSYTPPTTFPGTTTDPPSKCNEEVEISFVVPSVVNTSLVLAITIGTWDKEKDGDSYTWEVTRA